MDKNKKSKKLKLKKHAQINFNFSDDSEDEFDTKPFNKVQIKGNRSSHPDDQNFSSIISSDSLCQQTHLESLTEDFGLPIMDSTHIAGIEINKGMRHSPFTDITKEVQKKMQIVPDIYSKVNHREKLTVDSTGKIQSVSPDVRKPEKENVENLYDKEDSSFQSHSSSSLSNKNSIDHFTTAIEYFTESSHEEKSHPTTDSSLSPKEALCFTSTNCAKIGGKENTCARSILSDKDSNTKLSDGEGVALSQESTSYYVQDISIQTSLPRSILSDKDSNTKLSDGEGVALSQESTSYYVQDISIQTSLPFDESCVTSSPLPSPKTIHPNLSPEKPRLSTPGNSSSGITQNQRLSNPLDENQPSLNSPKDVQTHKSPPIFDDVITRSATQGPVVDVLAADSSSDGCSGDEKDEQESRQEAVIADSEDEKSGDENVVPLTNLSKAKDGSPDKEFQNCCETDEKKEMDSSYPVNSHKSDVVTDPKQPSTCEDVNDDDTRLSAQTSASSSTRKSSGESTRSPTEVEDITSSLAALSFQTGASSSRRRKISSSSDDDNFDNFLSKLKADTGKKKNPQNQKEIVPCMEEFIDDNRDESSEESNDDDDGCDKDDDAAFYIKTTRQLDGSARRRERKHFEKTYTYYPSNSSDSDSDHEFDAGLSEFIVDDDDDVTSPQKVKKSSDGNKKNHSTSVELEAEQVKGTSVESSVCLPVNSPRSKKQDKRRNAEERSDTRKDEDQRPSVPDKKPKSARTKLWPSNIGLDDSKSSDSDDYFVERRKETPSKTKSPFTSPFTTSKPKSKTSNRSLEITVEKKVPPVHPWTAPKPIRPPSASCHHEDDNDDTHFLKSLSSDYNGRKRHTEAERYIKKFKALKEELTAKLFDMFNDAVFESKIPSTVLLEWNVRYTTTAGTFSYKGRSPNDYTSKITLSTKICDNPERARDTLAHELCHAAVKLVNGANESHGPVWKSWARKVNKAFPFMPVVARCHDYIIHSKYTYQCTNCKYRIGRHSKSLDTVRLVCGHCKGSFQVFLTSQLKSSDGSSAAITPKAPRAPNRFALFVKENFSVVKKRNTDMKHGEIMKELSKEFAEKNKIIGFSLL